MSHNVEPAGNEGAALSKSVQRALNVLDLVASRPLDLGVTEVAAALGLPKSTAHRLLFNLQARGLVEQDPATERYRAGLRLFTLGAGALDRSTEKNALRSTSHRFLEELVARVGETGYLGILDRGEVLYLDSVEGPSAMRAASPTGARRPLHCTAIGKVLLAFGPPAASDRLIGAEPLPARTSKTVTDPDEFREGLARIRQEGYALDVGEFEEGLACMAAPVFGHDGAVLAAIGLSGPAWRLVDTRLATAIESLRQAAQAVSAEMGFRSPDDARRVPGAPVPGERKRGSQRS
jgi:IclR family transcriptional regulator, KDG regulon repressor